MSIIRLLTVALVGAGLSHAQRVAKIIGDEYLNASVVVAPFGAAVNIYKPEEATSKQLYFTHFFVVKGRRGSGGNPIPDVAVVNENEVHLTLLVSPPSLLGKIAAYIRQEEAANPIDPRFRTVSGSALIPAPFIRYRIEQQYGDVFNKVEQTIETLPGRIPLIAKFATNVEALEYAKALELGTKTALFRVVVQLNARTRSSTSMLEAIGHRSKNTDAVRELIGKGSALEIGTADNNSSLGIRALSVTRDQKTKFLGRLRDELSVALDIQSSEQRAVLENQLGQFLQRIFPASRDVALNAQFEQEIGRMSAYNFDPKDIKPSEVTKVMADVKKFFQSEEQERINIAASVSASFIGVGSGSASGSYNKETLKKSMEDKGWKFEQEGTHFIPKALEVAVVDVTSLDQDYTFRMSVRESAMGVIAFSGEPATNLSFVDDGMSWHPGASVPTGTIISFAGENVPEGWLECDGSERDAQTFPALADLLKNTYGTANAGKFKLPDLQGRVALGGGKYNDPVDGPITRSLGASAGAASVQIRGEQLPNHTHTVSGATSGQAGDSCCQASRALPATDGHTHYHTVNLVSQGVNVIQNAVGAKLSVLPPSIVVKYLIKF